MATYRILNQAPQYFLPSGKVNAGGSLTFYETDLSTPKGTWSDPGKSTPNANPVILDAAGRTSTDVWGDGAYGVVMRDAAGTTIWTRNNVQPAGSASQEIPALESGKFLTNDGTNLLWQAIANLLLPDMSGSNGYILSTDGANATWIPQPTLAQPNIALTNTSAILSTGSGERLCIQSGSGTIPAAGSRTSNVNITFPTAFTKIWAVLPMASTYAVNEYGAGATITAAGFTINGSASSATITANIVDDGGGSGATITNPVSFAWIAIGLIAAAE